MKHKVYRKEGYIPNEQTAIKVALAVWEPIYGKEKIEKQAPYKAKLKDEVWYVFGTLPRFMLGGTVEAEISKITGEIIRISHGR